MRRTALISSLFILAATSFTAASHAATVNVLKNPSTQPRTISGVRYLPSSYSKCANLTLAKRWKSYLWCPASVGTLTSKQVLLLNSPPATKTLGSGGFTVYYLNNPIVKQITSQDVRYRPSDYSRCSNSSYAKRIYGYYWCPLSVNPLTSGQVAALVNGSTEGASGGTNTASVKLSWTAPSSRVNGAPLALSELKGYEIYYTSDDLAQGVTISIAGGSKTQYVASSLRPGIYHFAISAIDTAGLKSALSPMVSTTVGR